MTAVATPDAARLVFAAVAGLILLLILIIKFKVHAMISILIGAVGIGLMAGMPLADIIGSVNDGIGNTLKGIALLVGLGSMFGAILEESGGAQTLAVTMVRKFGDEKAAWALGITGLVIAMPVFFDAGLIILIPLAFSLAKRTKRSVLYYVIPLLAGLAVGFWSGPEELAKKHAIDKMFVPDISEEERRKRLRGWHKAVRCAYNWARDDDEDE